MTFEALNDCDRFAGVDRQRAAFVCQTKECAALEQQNSDSRCDEEKELFRRVIDDSCKGRLRRVESC